MPAAASNELAAASNARAELEALWRLMELAHERSPHERELLAHAFRHPFISAEELERAQASNGRPHPLSELEAALAWTPLSPRPKEVTPHLLALTIQQRAELVRQTLLARESSQDDAAQEAIGALSETFLLHALQTLEDTPVPLHLQTNRWEGPGLDLAESTTPENTRLHRALKALQRQIERERIGTDPAVETLKGLTRRFVLAMLNPRTDIDVIDITDVYGTESNVPSPNDATVLRVNAHWQEVERRYGIEVNRTDQGTHIACPEQCGLYALAAVNQARRANRANGRQDAAPRFFILNNAARIASHDGIERGEAAQSSSLLYFTFDVGDGVIHSGVAYGDSTLTYLKPYIRELYEIVGTDRGTQFRSLEFEKHTAAVSAMADGLLPLCYDVKRLDVKGLPELRLADNEAQLIGKDKYGNALLSKPFEVLCEQFLQGESSTARVSVTLLDRDGTVLQEPEEYTLARHLGTVRDGSLAIWESSTPTTEDPTRGFASIGVFKSSPDDINESVVNLPAGSIVRIRNDRS